MKPSIVLLLGALFASSTSAQTAESVGLVNTGSLIGGNNPYSVSSASVAGTYGLYIPASTAWPINGVWLDNSSTAQWLGLYSGSVPSNLAANVPTVPNGDYHVQLLFDLGTISENDVSFGIVGAVDNVLAVSLNGGALSNFGVEDPNRDNNYNNLTHYLYEVNGATVGSTLKGGVNVLDFAISNTTNGPAGLYVQYGNFTVIPEPSTYALLLGAGTLGLALLRRRFRR